MEQLKRYNEMVCIINLCHILYHIVYFSQGAMVPCIKLEYTQSNY